MDDVVFVHNELWRVVAKKAYARSDSPGGSTEGEVMMSTLALFSIMKVASPAKW